MTEIKKEWVDVETRYYEANIENHVKSASLIGIWSNKLVQRLVKILVEEELWVEEISMERVIEMARINMKMATTITKEIIQNQKGLEEDTMEWEEQEHKEWRQGKFSKISEERMQGITDEEIQGFKQRWKVATKGAKLRKEMEERIENREKKTKKRKKRKGKEGKK